ncbi:MAG: hypothetical protein IAE80_18920 [Anaerolinea sp.]|nr:hypothetical protein [Anaerolinea sp.]
MTALFLTFWTFGTLDYYKPGEIAAIHEGAHTEEAAAAEGEAVVTEEGAVIGGEDGHAAEAEGEGVIAAESAEIEGEGAIGAEGEHAAEAEHYTNNDHIATEQLGVFGQAQRFLEEGRDVNFGPFTLPIGTVITLITLFLLLGATGKSAQIPLFIWLPDAMAGPTPVSALIHAATMVTAGVYMMVRSNVLFHEAELTSFVVTLIGVGTALVAGFIALGQWDIKRVLAYSTVSQLGFMVAAVGIGAYGAAMFHLVTHAFFKALLFLGSGSVIHGVEHGHHHVHHKAEHGGAAGHHDEATPHIEDEFDPQDMRNMGGLRRKMPITYWTYVIGTLALAGIFPFAGFWSKDEILADSWAAGWLEGNLGGYIALGGLLLAAGFTAFYMWRQVTLVFHGQPRTEAADHAPESVPSMTIPLLVLAFFSVVAGFFNVPSGLLGLDGIFGAHRFTDWLGQTVQNAHAGEFNLVIALAALGLAIVAIIVAANVYGRDKGVVNHRDPLALRRETAPLWSLANARMYWDETYNRIAERPFNAVSQFLANTLDWAFWHDYVHDTVIYKGFNAIGDLLSKPVDLGIIDGVVNGMGRLARLISGGLRPVQTGYVRTYAITLLVGVVLVIIVILLPLLQRG